jgi:hypothetical protein
MKLCAAIAGTLGGVLCIAALSAASANERPLLKRPSAPSSLRGGIGTFTPAAGDARLAAALAGSGISHSGFRFTPSAASDGRNRAVRVAVRARTAPREVAAERLAPSATTAIGIAPVAYNLGVGVGWKRFALAGDVARVDAGGLPGSREAVDVGVSYNANKWSTRVQVAADRPVGNVPRAINGGESMSLDVGGSFRLTRNIDVTAGVRYRSERDRLERVADTRRDSQAVYVGTAFRF